MKYQIADERRLRIIEEAGGDFIDDFVGLNKVCFCTREYLRRVLRNIFDNRAQHNPYLAIHLDEENHIYEGVKVNGWQTDHTQEPPVEFVEVEMAGISSSLQFAVNNIRSVLVC